MSLETITVIFDPDNPELALPIDVPPGGATVFWVKEELCRQDPTGSAQPDSFRLCAADRPEEILDDSVAITPALATLVLQPGEDERKEREEKERKAQEEKAERERRQRQEQEDLDREEYEIAMQLAQEEASRQAKEEAIQREKQARREKAEALEKLQVDGGGPIESGGPTTYLCGPSGLFLKKSANPRSGKIVKQKRDEGSEVPATGRTWTGPSGGVWAELKPNKSVAKEEGWDTAWALVEGPGFGLEGPALIDPNGPPPSERVYDNDEEDWHDDHTGQW